MISAPATPAAGWTAPTARPVPRGVALRAVVRRGLRDQRRAVLTWGGALGAFGAFMAAIYPSVQDTIEQVARNYPAGLREAFGVGAMNTVEGYVHAELFSLIVPLALGFFAARSVTRPLVVAEEHGQLDTDLSLPLDRTTLVAGAAVVTAILAAGILAVLGLMTFVAGRIAGTGISAGLTAAGVTGVWPLAVFFAGVAVLATGVLHRSASVLGVATGALVGMYALDLAARLTNALEWIGNVSVFHWYGSPLTDGLDVVACVGVVAVGAVLTAAGAVLLGRRDIRH